MKKYFISSILTIFCLVVNAQNYTLTSIQRNETGAIRFAKVVANTNQNDTLFLKSVLKAKGNNPLAQVCGC